MPLLLLACYFFLPLLPASVAAFVPAGSRSFSAAESFSCSFFSTCFRFTADNGLPVPIRHNQPHSIWRGTTGSIQQNRMHTRRSPMAGAHNNMALLSVHSSATQEQLMRHCHVGATRNDTCEPDTSGGTRAPHRPRVALHPLLTLVRPRSITTAVHLCLRVVVAKAMPAVRTAS